MSIRIIRHIGFWLVFIMLYVITRMLFATESDMEYPVVHRFFRFLIAELAFIPWKIIPFYFLFYFLVPRYFRKGKYLKTGLLFLGILLFSLVGYRTMVAPVLTLMYDETPDFNIYSPKRFLWSLLEILPALGIASAVKLLIGSIASQKKEEELHKEKLASELNYLKAQTNPHFLFNTLNNLYGLARKNDQNTAPSIMKLSNIMRYILYECNVNTIPIQNEVRIIEDYIELEKLRYNDRLRITFESTVDNWQQEIAPLILLPFVENAFKHGASEARFDTLINIQLQLDQDQLVFSIENSYDSSNRNIQEGIGMKNVKRQLDLIYGEYYTLNIVPGEALYSVHLTIQLNKADD